MGGSSGGILSNSPKKMKNSNYRSVTPLPNSNYRSVTPLPYSNGGSNNHQGAISQYNSNNSLSMS